MNLRPYLEFAVQNAYEAGRLTLGYFGTEAARPEFKADDTPVTVADREAERLIRERIEARYPNHAIVGEEFGETSRTNSSDHLWLLDPIDGTKSFVRGVPLYGVLIGLQIDGVCEVGAAYFPALDEMICAATGEGCYLNGRRTHASTRSLAQGVACFTDVASFEEHGRTAAWDRMLSAAGSVRGWSDAYGHALVATGRAELMLDPIMNPWDCGPFPPILREAGGYFGDWSGNETIYANEAMSTTRTIFPELLHLVDVR